MPTIVDIEKNGVSKRVRTPEAEIESRGAGERGGKLGDELVEPRLVDLVSRSRCFANESELLQRDVEKVIGVGANERNRGQTAPDLVERRLQDVGRNANRDQRVNAWRPGPPLSRVMATVGHGGSGAKRLPDTPV